MTMFSQDEITEALELIKSNYGYLIETAESICSNSKIENRHQTLQNIELENIKAKIEQKLEILDGLHDYRSRVVVSKRI